MIYRLLRAEIERQKQLKGLTNADIAKAIGKAKNTVDIFMMNTPRHESKAVADAIAEYFGIESTESEADDDDS